MDNDMTKPLSAQEAADAEIFRLRGIIDDQAASQQALAKLYDGVRAENARLRAVNAAQSDMLRKAAQAASEMVKERDALRKAMHEARQIAEDELGEWIAVQFEHIPESLEAWHNIYALLEREADHAE